MSFVNLVIRVSLEHMWLVRKGGIITHEFHGPLTHSTGSASLVVGIVVYLSFQEKERMYVMKIGRISYKGTQVRLPVVKTWCGQWIASIWQCKGASMRRSCSAESLRWVWRRWRAWSMLSNQTFGWRHHGLTLWQGTMLHECLYYGISSKI